MIFLNIFLKYYNIYNIFYFIIITNKKNLNKQIYKINFAFLNEFLIIKIE